MGMMMAALKSSVVFDVGGLRELLILIESLRLVSRAISTKMALVLSISCGSLDRGTVSLLAYRWMIVSAEKEARINLVDIHALRPGGGVIAEAIGSMDLGMVHVVRQLSHTQGNQKGYHVD